MFMTKNCKQKQNITDKLGEILMTYKKDKVLNISCSKS